MRIDRQEDEEESEMKLPFMLMSKKRFKEEVDAAVENVIDRGTIEE